MGKDDQPKQPSKAPEVGRRSKFAGLGPDGNLDDFRQFGLGTLTAKPIELILGRSAFFVATRKVASKELKRLQTEVLPLYRKVLQLGVNHGPGAIPVVVIETSDERSRKTSAHTIDDWPSLCEGAIHLDYVAELRDSVHRWAQQHSLTDPWLLDTILINLCMWANSPDRHQALDWTYPGGHLISKKSKGAKGVSLIMGSPGGVYIESRPPDESPRPYDPVVETRSEYIASLEPYLDKQEAVFRSIGFHKTKLKRKRVHFEWLVRYQIQSWSQRQIADAYSDTTLTEDAIGKAVRETAELVGLTVRQPDKGGRRPVKSTP